MKDDFRVVTIKRLIILVGLSLCLILSAKTPDARADINQGSPENQQNQGEEALQQPDQQQSDQQQPQEYPAEQQMQPPLPQEQAVCAIKVSQDRTSFSIVSNEQVREYVPLGQDRVRKIFNSPDTIWGLVVFKVRQQAKYAAIAVDLVKCEPQEAVELPGLATDASFEGEEVALTFEGGGAERYKLRNKTLP